MARWTLSVIRHRKAIIAAWIALFLVGGVAAAGLGDLLSNRFSVPGSDAERGLTLLKDHMHERSDGAFTLVVQGQGRPPERGAVAAAARRAARAIEGGRAGAIQRASPTVAYVQISTPLENEDAAKETPTLRKAIGSVPGATTYLTGYPALNHDTQPIYNDDLTRGETIALPVAIFVMAFMFGTAGAFVVPLLFAAVTIPITLGLVWIFAHYMDMAIYVTNIVTLIGFAIAIDYSMLVIFRFREELAHTESVEEALVTTMKTAGRATLFSGATVAIGLALLVFMPLPFMRSMGVGGLLVPLFSIAASATFLPALLAVLGRKINRLRVIPRRILEARAEGRPGFWTRLSHSIMRHPIPYAVGAAGLLIALAIPAFQLHLTGGDNRGTPKTTEATEGLAILERTLGPGALAPNQVAIDTHQRGGAIAPAIVAAEGRLVKELRADPQIDPRTIQAPILLGRGPQGLAAAQKAHLIDQEDQVIQIRAAGRNDAGTSEAMDLVHRIRDQYIPQARFPSGTTVLLTGAPAFGVDFIDRAYGAFPWLVLAVLALSYLLLLRAFRSIFLPVKAVLMNILSVSATYGVLVLVFEKGVHAAIGLQGLPQVEAWIPIFLFAMLFGLSMDYEVFLLSRMREEWDAHHDNERAVAHGLEMTGRIITAAAIVMIAAFSGFTAGSFVGLQQFGLGLSVAIFLDATIVRAILVPAVMKLLGEWNWYLPERVRRALRVAPSKPATQTGGSD